MKRLAFIASVAMLAFSTNAEKLSEIKQMDEATFAAFIEKCPPNQVKRLAKEFQSLYVSQNSYITTISNRNDQLEREIKRCKVNCKLDIDHCIRLCDERVAAYTNMIQVQKTTIEGLLKNQKKTDVPKIN